MDQSEYCTDTPDHDADERTDFSESLYVTYVPRDGHSSRRIVLLLPGNTS